MTHVVSKMGSSGHCPSWQMVRMVVGSRHTVLMIVMVVKGSRHAVRRGLPVVWGSLKTGDNRKRDELPAHLLQHHYLLLLLLLLLLRWCGSDGRPSLQLLLQLLQGSSDGCPPLLLLLLQGGSDGMPLPLLQLLLKLVLHGCHLLLLQELLLMQLMPALQHNLPLMQLHGHDLSLLLLLLLLLH